jgi:hypothetical protein
MSNSLFPILLVFATFALGALFLPAIVGGVDLGYNTSVVGTSLEGPHEMVTNLLGGGSGMIFVIVALIISVLIIPVALFTVLR